MECARPYPYWAAKLLTLASLTSFAVGCGSQDEPTSHDDRSTAGAASSTADYDESADEGEPALDPGRTYAAPIGDAARNAGSPSQNSSASKGDSDSDEAAAPLPPTRAEPTTAAPAVNVNPFVDTAHDPFSTFGADVDTASYDRLRQSLRSGVLPEPQVVRVEDYVNYFDYAYATPAADAAEPFTINLHAAAHPMARATTLLRVGIKAKAAPVVAERAANLVFLVDSSGSMASADKLPLVKRVLDEALAVLAPSDKVSIVTYSGDTRVRLAPTLVSDRAAIAAAIAGIQAAGGTDGGSGLNLAYEQAQAALVPGGINHVVLCTDGDFNLGITSDEALVQLIRQKRDTGITLTALGFGSQRVNDAMMEKVSNAGNGSYSIVFSEDQAVEYANERLLSTIVHVAKDMKIQVEFNPAAVAAYRLLGYENRAIADGSFRDDTVDGGEVGAEHRVTALYELVLTGGLVPQVAGAPALSQGEVSNLVAEIDPSELVRVKVRSKPVTATDADPAGEVVASLTPADVQAAADADLAWASAVATLAELLRKSPYAAASELEAIERIVAEQQTRDAARAELATLLPTVRPLLNFTPTP